MDPLAANPLHLKPCLGFYCLQLLLFSNLFWSDVWQDYVSWKQVDMDYLRNSDKQRRLMKFSTIARLSSRVENPTSRIVHGNSVS